MPVIKGWCISIGIIYKAENIHDGKVYVGQTTYTLEFRWRRHVKEALAGNDGCKYLHRAIRKYGEDAFRVTVIENVPDDILDERESFWISELDTYRNGYNCTLGGEGNKKANYDAIRKAWDSGASVSEIIRDLGHCKETIHRALETHYSYTKDEEILRNKQNVKIPQTFNKGNPNLSVTYNSNSEPIPKKRPVVQYDMFTLSPIATYDSIIEAAHGDTTFAVGIRACCIGKNKSSHGYIWRYANDEPPMGEYKTRHMRKVVQLDKETGNLINSFDSMTEAKNNTGVSIKNIQNACSGTSKTAGGFVWRYAEDYFEQEYYTNILSGGISHTSALL